MVKSLLGVDYRNRTKEMLEGLELAKVHLKTLVAQVQTFLESKQIVCAGPFLYASVPDVSETLLVGNFWSIFLCI